MKWYRTASSERRTNLERDSRQAVAEGTEGCSCSVVVRFRNCGVTPSLAEPQFLYLLIDVVSTSLCHGNVVRVYTLETGRCADSKVTGAT